MGMKFLNKKGWHTGSLRNIENVWKAEQKQEAEQKKLEELRLQLVQERERSEFRALQEQAGLVPRQERLEFLYDSGLAVGKGSASGSGVSFQKEEQPLAKAEAGTSEKPDPSVPGALFEDKAQSANDSWRKLHSDPLLLIRQREQEALARIKNNPVKMALIRKSVEEKGKDKDGDKKKHKKKHQREGRKHRKESPSRHQSDSEEDSGEENKGRKSNHHKTLGTHDKHYNRRKSELDDDESKSRNNKHYERPRSDIDEESKRRESRDKHYERRRSDLEDESKRRESRDKHYERRRSDLEDESKRRESHDKHYERRRSDLEDESKRRESHDKHYERRRSDLNDEPKRRQNHDKHYERRRSDLEDESERRVSHKEPQANEKYQNQERENLKSYGQEDRKRKTEDLGTEKHSSRENETNQRRRKGGASKLSEEERAARLKQMQMDAEVHEEQRWTRLKKADETDALEADKNKVTIGKSFLDDANKSMYGIEKGGSSTIEESVRRRSYYSQRGNEAEGNAFRR